MMWFTILLRGFFILIFNSLIEYIDLGINFDNNKYIQKLPHFEVMTKQMSNNYLFLIKSIIKSIIKSRFHDKKVVTCHPLCKNLEMWKLWVIVVINFFLQRCYERVFWKHTSVLKGSAFTYCHFPFQHGSYPTNLLHMYRLNYHKIAKEWDLPLKIPHFRKLSVAE